MSRQSPFARDGRGVALKSDSFCFSDGRISPMDMPDHVSTPSELCCESTNLLGDMRADSRRQNGVVNCKTTSYLDNIVLTAS